MLSDTEFAIDVPQQLDPLVVRTIAAKIAAGPIVIDSDGPLDVLLESVIHHGVIGKGGDHYAVGEFGSRVPVFTALVYRKRAYRRMVDSGSENERGGMIAREVGVVFSNHLNDLGVSEQFTVER
ncbi:hypothetical protein B0H11DRAFT_1916455 [Mycena galericulata]|nr:hypothetical protein B0H11DRAFT_1916455 [Mycena galericulata]